MSTALPNGTPRPVSFIALFPKHHARLEEASGWAKAVGGIVQTMHRGAHRG